MGGDGLQDQVNLSFLKEISTIHHIGDCSRQSNTSDSKCYLDRLAMFRLFHKVKRGGSSGGLSSLI